MIEMMEISGHNVIVVGLKSNALALDNVWCAREFSFTIAPRFSEAESREN